MKNYDLAKMFGILSDNTLPSAQERKGIRVPRIPRYQISAEKFHRDDTDNFYKNLRGFGQSGVDWYYNNTAKNMQQQALDNIPKGTQLDIFATSGEDAFKDLLDSDAITGASMPEIMDLDQQFTATQPISYLADNLKNIPEVMENINAANIHGQEGLTAAELLGRLYRMLLPK